MKTCNECKLKKSKEEFYTNNSLHDKLTGRCKQCINDKYRQQVIKNPEAVRLKQKEKDLKGRYNLSLLEYESMLTTQEGKCGICRKETKLVVDHCHNTGKVRMLLCVGCNNKLGIIENEIMFNGLMEYIEKFK